MSELVEIIYLDKLQHVVNDFFNGSDRNEIADVLTRKIIRHRNLLHR